MHKLTIPTALLIAVLSIAGCNSAEEQASEETTEETTETAAEIDKPRIF